MTWVSKSVPAVLGDSNVSPELRTASLAITPMSKNRQHLQSAFILDVIATGLSQFRTVGNRVAEGCTKYAERGKARVFLIQVGNRGCHYVGHCVFVERLLSY